MRTKKRVRYNVKRRQFVDPKCHKCGEVPVVYREGGRGYLAKCSVCGQSIGEFSRKRVPARVRLARNPKAISFEIRYPKRPSEFEIQAYLYTELRKLGYDARGEVATYDGDCRFDVVVFECGKPARIIEVKGDKKRYRSRQIEQYRQYGVAVVSVCGAEQAKALIARAASRQRRPLPPLL